MLRALAAQVTLLLCVLGLPLLLAATIGNPLHGLGSLREGQVTDAVVIDLLACLAYLCWAQFVLAVLTELAGAMRHARRPTGRQLPPPRRVPGVFAGQQHLAHSLVVAALLLLPALSSASVPLRMPTIGPPPALPTVTVSWQQHAPTVSSATTLAATTSPVATPQTASRTYLVPASGGPATYWDLATTFLGSGEHWEQIWHLNEGRTQADGAVMDSPNLLRPGWTVLLPATAADPTSAPPTTQPPGPLRPVIVHPGDSFAGLAEADGVTDWPTLWPANDDRGEPNGQHFTDPALIRPGWTVLLPGNPSQVAPHDPRPPQPPSTTPTPAPQQPPLTRSVPTTGPSSSTPTTSPTAPSATDPPSSSSAADGTSVPVTPSESSVSPSRSPVSNAPRQSDVSDLPAVVVWGGTGSLLAGLSLAALLKRRRRQQRHRRPGRVITSPPPRLRATECQLATYAGVSGVDANMLTSALRTLIDALSGNPGEHLPDITAAHLDSDIVELMLATPNQNAPSPWTSDDSGTRWRVPRGLVPTDIAGAPDWLAPYPALTSVGVGPDADQWLMDLEHFRTIAVSGPPEPRRNLLRYLAAELAHNTWAEQVHVSMVGFGRELAAINPTRVTYHEQPGTAIAQVRAHLIGISEASTQTRTTILDGRLNDIAGDAWTPHILLIELPEDADPADRDDAATMSDPQPHITASDRTALADLVNDLASAPTRAGIAVVLAVSEAFPEAECTMTITTDGMLAIPDLAVHARACQLTATEAEDLTGLLAVAANLADNPMPDALGEAEWDAYADAAGAPQRRLATESGTYPPTHLNNASSADTASHSQTADSDEITKDSDEQRDDDHRVTGHADMAPAQTMLPLPVQVYLAKAATTVTDLDALTPPLPQMTRDAITRADTSLDADLAAWRDPDSSVPKLHLLGPVVLTGVGSAPEGRGALLTELIAYLLTRPRGATVEELASALWPHIPNAASKTTPRQSVSAARQWLGVSDRTHRERLPRATADTGGARLYRITDVLVDAELFRRLRLRASARGEAGIEDLQAALDLVTGPPFAQRRPGGYSWLAETPLNHAYTAMIVDVAHLVATHHLATENPDGAASAAQVSLSVDAGDDVALLDLLAAAEAHGNDAEARTYLQRILANHNAEVEEDLPPRTFEVLLRRGSIERLNAARG